MLDVHRLRLLHELDRRGTLAEVAAALGYSRSAVSQQLSQLQREAGVQLLEPAGRRVRLTAAGRVLVGHADAVLAQLEQAEADLAALGSTARGTLRVAAFASVLLSLVPDALTWLAEHHPDLRVELVEQEPAPALSALTAHDADLVLGEEYPGSPTVRSPGVDVEDLLHDEFRLAVPLEGALAGRGHRLEDHADVPWVMEPPRLDPGRWALARCREAGFEPDVRIITSDVLLHAHLVASGHAAALVPDLVRAGRTPGVVLHRLPERPRRRLFTAVRRGAATSPGVRALRESLRVAVDAAGA
ncbi:LysR family transcriptional regulator [uncultured Pseudokineococcus sp.]|uniref:LysR family transcriptional regulator n=1 Tax=uncultured Pseudokineococcus sp. TaxID=1642928 RepID=UPI0026168F66|nr:LysR family transcriptional regulator [uncultured Pseudokineococcus sp.]